MENADDPLSDDMHVFWNEILEKYEGKKVKIMVIVEVLG